MNNNCELVVAYTIVREEDLQRLLYDMRKKLADGWQPQGGVVHDGRAYVQAIVKVGSDLPERPTTYPRKRRLP